MWRLREESCSVDASDNLQLHPLGAVFLAAYGLSMLPWHLARPFSTCHLDWNEGELRGDEVKEDPFPLPSLTSPIPLMHHPIRQHLLCPSFIPNLRNRRCRIRLQSVVVELVQVWACLVDFWGCMSIERGFWYKSPSSLARPSSIPRLQNRRCRTCLKGVVVELVQVWCAFSRRFGVV